MGSVKIYLFFLTLTFIVLSCSSSVKINDISSIDVVQNNIDGWFNLMPGPSPGRFHLQGEIKLANTSAADIDDINLKSITIYYNKELIYNFKPYFKPVVKDDDYSLKMELSKEFRFGTESGLKIDSRVKEVNAIDVKLNFAFDEENFLYEITDVEIKRVY